MDSKLLDYVILGLLFLIAINLFLNMFGIIGKEEGMSQLQEEAKQENVAPEAAAPAVEAAHVAAPAVEAAPAVAPVVIAPAVETAPVINAEPQSVPVVKVLTEQTVPKAPEADVQIPSVQENKPKEVPIGPIIEEVRRIQPENVQAEKNAKRQEIQNYQNEMFELNDTVNKSSAGVDVVDKINMLYTARNTESSGLQGKTISQVYDGMTQNIIDRKKRCVYDNCLIPPVVDALTKTESYVLEAGNAKYFRRGRMYEDDSVETGAKFYGQIEANDKEFEDFFVLQNQK